MTDISFVQWICVACMILSVAWIVWIDARTLRIPDAANLAVALSGAVYQLTHGREQFILYLIESGGVGCAFYLARAAHASLSGRIGLGLGDVKFLGAATLWIGLWNLPLFMLAASCSALLYAVAFSRVQAANWRTSRVPFGPFLGLALLAVWYADDVLFLNYF